MRCNFQPNLFWIAWSYAICIPCAEIREDGLFFIKLMINFVRGLRLNTKYLVIFDELAYPLQIFIIIVLLNGKNSI